MLHLGDAVVLFQLTQGLWLLLDCGPCLMSWANAWRWCMSECYDCARAVVGGRLIVGHMYPMERGARSLSYVPTDRTAGRSSSICGQDGVLIRLFSCSCCCRAWGWGRCICCLSCCALGPSMLSWLHCLHDMPSFPWFLQLLEQGWRCFLGILAFNWHRFEDLDVVRTEHVKKA